MEPESKIKAAMEDTQGQDDPDAQTRKFVLQALAARGDTDCRAAALRLAIDSVGKEIAYDVVARAGVFLKYLWGQPPVFGLALRLAIESAPNETASDLVERARAFQEFTAVGTPKDSVA